MTPVQPIFNALGLLVETARREEDALWSHRCSAPVKAPGHELGNGKGTNVFVLGSVGKSLKYIRPWELKYIVGGMHTNLWRCRFPLPRPHYIHYISSI